MNRQTEQYIRQIKNRKRLGSIVAVLCVLVALITTYVLMLPGITMEHDMLCGLENHTHTEACREMQLTCGQTESSAVTETVQLSCTFQPHAHTDQCRNAAWELVCGWSDTYWHLHDELCRDANGALLCSLKEKSRHYHNDGCYETINTLTCKTPESEGHTHTDSCKGQGSEPICGIARSEGHIHTDECSGSVLACQLTENPGHTHDDTCAPETVVICTIPEGDGAHAHEAACYGEAQQKCTDDTHTHTEECYEKPLVCTLVETAGHLHGEGCTAAKYGCGKEPGADAHTHTDACYTTGTVCGREAGEGAHTHETACCPQDVLLCGKETGEGAHAHGEGCYASEKKLTCTLLHQHEKDCFRTVAGIEVAVCGSVETEEHQHTQLCRTTVVNTVAGHTHTDACYTDTLICGLEEHEHTGVCYPDATEEPTVTEEPTPTEEPTVTEEPTPTEEPAVTEAPAAVVYYCGMEAHCHGDSCLDESWNLVCTLPVHEHSSDCTYACCQPAHTHSHTSTGGVMLLSLEDDYGCYDADGNLICTLGEHTHTEACAYAAGAGSSGAVTLGNGDSSDFGNYVTNVKVHTDGKQDDYYKPTYDPSADAYSTSIDISFNIPNSVLTQDRIYSFIYDLPENVGATSDTNYTKPYNIINSAGVKVGEFYIKPKGDGTFYLDIQLDEQQVDQNTNCTGTLYFECSIDADATREDGSIYVEFEQNIGFEVNGSDINRSQTETALYSITTEKTGANNGAAYDPATGMLTYQVSVKTKGTPGEISLVDSLNVNGLAIESQQITSVKLINNWQTTDVSNYTATQNGNNMNITLPKVEPSSVPDGQTAEYLITYQVKLADSGYGNTYLSAGNSVTATSGAGTPNEVKDSGSVSENHDLKMLEKTGSYDAGNDVINWTVTFNQSGKNISGMTLTDQMLGSLPDATGVTVIPGDGGYALQYGSDGRISGIRFQNNTTSTYQITYQTKPTQDFAGNYAEANKVTVLDPSGQPVVENEYTVNNINRNQQPSKSVTASEKAADGKSMTIDWKVEIPIDSDGLSNDAILADNMTPNGRHYMTYSQLSALYNQVKDMLAKTADGKPAMTVDVITSGVNGSGGYQASTTNIEDVLNSGDTSAVFGALKLTLDNDSAAIAPLRSQNLTLTYTSTAYTDGLTNNTQFGNWAGMGEHGSSGSFAAVDFVADNTNPVTKYCGDYCNNNGECAYYHQDNDPFSWGISVYQNDEYDFIRVEDTLPAGVSLTDVYLGQNLQTRLSYDASAAPDGSGFYPLTLTPNGDTSGLAVTGKYNPQTRQLVVDVRPDDDPNTLIYESFGKNKTLKLKVRASVSEDQRPAPGETREYQLPNTTNVYVSKNNSETFYDDDSHTYKLRYTTPDLVTKKDMNWQENNSVMQNYKPDNFGWIVEVLQDKEYEQLVITDTLPEIPTLTKITVGSTTIEVVRGEDGSVTLTPHLHSDEEGLLITPVYDAATRQVTITVQRNQGSALKDDPNHTKGYGDDQTLYVRYYCTLPEDHLASADNPSVSNSYTNTVSVDFTKDNQTITGTDDQTITTQFTYNPPVIKYGVGSNNQDSEGDVTVNSATGELVWKVKVRQADLYDYVVIEDRLPAGMIELNPDKGEGVIQLKQWSGYWMRLGESTDGGITYPLVAYNQNNQNETCYGYEGSYNAQTGQIYIKLNANPWRNNGVLENESMLVFYCRVTEDYMPNTEDGQYAKELGEVTNNVTVSTNEGYLGQDGQTQYVTVTQQRPDFTVVDKNTPVYDSDTKTLHYVVDINPTQQDMDPAKNTVTVVDTASYSINQPYVDMGFQSYPASRSLTLMQDSVKLYYADYDENGNPLLQDGKLVPGELVDPSKWNMAYTESENGDNATRTITLVVPDSRALVLVYDYEVSMSNSHRNVPLNINNAIYAEGYQNKADSSRSDDNDKWSSDGGGGFIIANVLVKHDAANQSNVLSGVRFNLEQYVNGQWTVVKEMLTDANGRILIPSAKTMFDQSGELEYDRLYRLIETESIAGYEVPDPVPSYAFYWSYWENGTGLSVPSGFAIADAVNLQYNENTTFYAPNAKKATSLGVEKVWRNPDGSLMSDRDKPSSVTVDLHRYAIPEAEWNRLVQESGGRINGELETGVTNTNVTVTVKSNSYGTEFPTAVVEAKVGSVLTFDVNVIRGGYNTSEYQYNYKPVFDGLSPVSYEVRNGQEYYRYQVQVTEGLVLEGRFVDEQGGLWGGDIRQYIAFANIDAQVAIPDDSAYAAQLQNYVDRSYVLSMKLTSAGNWQGLWENLDTEGEVTAADGTTTKVHYKYYVTETPPSGYATRITGYSSDNGGSFVVENQKDGSRTETTNLRIKKRWFGGNGEEYVYDKASGIWTDTNGNRYVFENDAWYAVQDNNRTLITDGALLSQLPLSSVSVRLLRKNLLAGSDAPWENYIYNQNASTVINANTNWMYNFVDLPLRTYNAQGQLVESYDYFIEEIIDGEYIVELVSSEPEEDASGREYEVITVKNSALREDVSVQVTKRWAEGSMPSGDPNVTVVLGRQIYTENGYVTDNTFAAEALEKGLATEATLSAANGWTHKWEGLANGATDANGAMQSYSYTVTETMVNGIPLDSTLYEASYAYGTDGSVTITNEKVIPKTQITAEKVWLDENGQQTDAPADVASVTLKLMRKAGESGSAEYVQDLSLNAANRWKLVVDGLEKFVPVNGEPSDTAYIYYVVEDPVPEGYAVSYSNSADGVSFAKPENDWVTVTNRPVTDLTIRKLWQNTKGETAAPAQQAVYVKLFRDGSEYALPGVAMQDGYMVLSAQNGWKVSGAELPDGTYTVKEYRYENGTYTEVAGAAVAPNSGNAGTQFTITNTVTGIGLEKKWLNADGTVYTPESGASATFTLMRRSSYGGNDEPVRSVTLNGSEQTPWTYYAENLPAKGQNGESYAYYFVETTQDASFSASYSNSADGSAFTALNDATVTVTNTKHIELKVEKAWENEADATQSVQFELYRIKTPVGGTGSGSGSTTVTDVTYTFNIIYLNGENTVHLEQVQRTFKSNEYIIWVPTYQPPSGWDGYHPTGNTITSDQGDTYTFVPSSSSGRPYTYRFDLGLAGETNKTITWLADDWYWGNQYNGTEDYRNNWSHQFETSAVQTLGSRAADGGELVGTYTLNGTDGWSITFNENDLQLLPDAQYTYTYYVKEVGMDGYTVVYDNNEGISSGVIRMTNTKDAPEDVVETTTTALNLTKTWAGAADYKPGSIRLTMTRTDGVTGATHTHTITMAQQNGVLTAVCEPAIEGAAFTAAIEGETWKLAVTNLPESKTVNGTDEYRYTYAITAEEAVEGFTASQITNNGQGNYSITNTRNTTAVKAVKVWGEGTPNAKPDVTLTLYRFLEQNGTRVQQTVESITLTGGAAEKQWQNLPAYGSITENGTTLTGAFTYYVEETPVEGYTAAVSPEGGIPDAAGTVTFENTPTQLKVEKQWLDGAAEKTVTFRLWRRVGEAPAPEEPDQPDQPGITDPCPTCGNSLSNGQDHSAAACGSHYVCADGYTEAAHAECGVCHAWLCNGAQHGEGVCGSTSGGEEVTISLEIWYKGWGGGSADVRFDGFASSITVPKGSQVVWQIHNNLNWYDTMPVSVTYDGGSIAAETVIGSGDGRTHTLTFTAVQSGIIRLTEADENGGAKGTWTDQGYTTSGTTAYTLRSAARSGDPISETVNTEGAEQVSYNGATEFELSAAKGWSHIFHALPAVNENGEAYNYFVQEVDTGEYIISYGNNDGIAPGSGESIIIRNSPNVPDVVVETTALDLTLTKQWEDAEDYKPQSLTFRLTQKNTLDETAAPNEHIITVNLAGGTPAASSDTLSGLNLAQGENGSWTITVPDLPHTRTEDGTLIYDYTYTLTEDPAEGFTAQITDDGQGNYSITNTRNTTAVKAVKVWGEGTPNAKPDVTLTLYRFLEQNGTRVQQTVESITLTGGAAEKQWQNLPAYGSITENGTTLTGAFTYYVEETPVEGYTAAVSPEGGIPDAAGTVTFTNTPTQLKVEKQWLDGAAEKTVTFRLWRRVGEAPAPEEPDQPDQPGITDPCPTCGNSLSNGQDHSAAACGSHYVCADGYTEGAHAECGVCHAWLCNGAQHGEGVCGSTSGSGEGDTVTVSLTYATGVQEWNTYTEHWTKGPVTVPKGETVVWKLVYSGDWNPPRPQEDTLSYSGSEVAAVMNHPDGSQPHYEYTLTFQANESGTILWHSTASHNGVAGTWTDQGYTTSGTTAYTLRSAARSGDPVSETVNTEGAEQVSYNGATEFELSAAKGWSHIFHALPAVNENGEAYNYFVQEVDTGEYIISYGNNDGIAPGSGESIIIRNSPVATEDVVVTTTTALNLTKTWEGAADYKPDSLRFTMTRTDANGTETAYTITMAQQNGALSAACDPAIDGAAFTAAIEGEVWKLTVADLPESKTVNGADEYRYTYAITAEEAVEGFTASRITDDGQGNYSLTNTRNTIPVTVQKRWIGNLPAQRPDVEMTLYYGIPQDNGCCFVRAEREDNPITLTGGENPELSYTWTDLPAYGTYTYQDPLTGETVTLTGSFVYKVEETPVDGYISENAPNNDGTTDANGTVTFENTPTRLKVEKQWLGYAHGETDGYTVYLQLLKDGAPVDPALYAGVERHTISAADSASEYCFAATGESPIVFYGLPAGEYTLGEVAWKPEGGEIQPIEDAAQLEWIIGDAGSITLPAENPEEEPTLALTNTKRTRLDVEKQWGAGTQPVEVQFELYRTTGDVPTTPDEPEETLCGGCGNPVADAGEHKAACGHFTCDGSYTEAAHALCQCGSYLCNGSDHTACTQPEPPLCETCRQPVIDESAHAYAPCGQHRICMDGYAEAEHRPCGVCGEALCNGTDHTACGGAEEVTITLRLWYNNFSNNHQKTLFEGFSPTITVPKGSVVEWKINNNSNWYQTDPLSVTYSGGSVSYSKEFSNNTGRTYTFRFTAAESGILELHEADNNGVGEVWSDKGYTIADSGSAASTAAYTARSTNASQTVNTDGAEPVAVNGETLFTIPAGGSYTFWDLPAADATGAAYKYFVKEVTEGYVVSYLNNGGVAPDGSVITITNSEPEIITASLTVRKTWLNEDGSEAAAPPNYAVYYELWEVGGAEAFLTGDGLVLSQNNGWTQTHTGLDPARSYYVKEVSVLNGATDMLTFYQTTYQGGEGTQSATAADAAVTGGGTVTVINRLKPTYTLPNTGGSGTHLYTGAGALLILIALGLAYKGNKGKRRADA